MQIKKTLSYVSITAACLMVLLFAFISGHAEWESSSFIPFNGHFQNYWSLARMSAGQTPFVDFPVYLGAGHLYVSWPLYYILGGDFRASTAAHNALAGASVAASIIITCRLLGWRWIPTLIFTIGMWQVFIVITTAWSSVIGFRSFLPALMALFIKFLLPEKNKLSSTLIYGGVAGLCPFWSNDYGIPALLSMILVLLMYSGIRSVFYAIIAATVGFIVGASAISWGHPIQWFNSAIIEASSVQTWYFNPMAENKIYSLMDFPWYDPAFLMGCLSAIITFFIICRTTDNSTQRRSYYALLGLTICATGGLALSCLAGTYEQRYAIPLWRYMIPVLPSLFFILFMKTSIGKNIKKRYPLFSDYPIMSGGMAVVFTGLSIASVPHPLSPLVDLDFAQKELVKSPSLNVKTWPEVVEADLKGRELYAHGMSVGADYSSIMSVATHSMQKVSPYIIHAASPQSSQKFMLNLTQEAPDVWETLDPDVIAWGLWNIRMSWPLHRELFLSRYPAERTAWTLLWKKRAERRDTIPAFCTVITKTGRPEIKVETNYPGIWWADVKIEISTSFTEGLTPIAGKTGLIDLTEGDDMPPDADPTSIVAGRWTAPLKSGLIEAPSMVSIEKPGRIRLRSWPHERSSVSVNSCSASLIAPVTDTVMRKQLEKPYVVTTTRSIDPFETTWHEHGKTAIRVILENPYSALTIRRGDNVTFEDGSTGIVVLRDFGNFAYIPHITPFKYPPQGSKVTITPNKNSTPLGVLIDNIVQ